MFPAEVRTCPFCFTYLLTFTKTEKLYCLFLFFISAVERSSSDNNNIKSELVTPVICKDEETPKAVQADQPCTVSTERNTESTDPQLDTQPPPLPLLPPSPVMDLETDFPSGEITHNVISAYIYFKSVCSGCILISSVCVPAESLGQRSSAPQRGVKRPREGFSGRKRV